MNTNRDYTARNQILSGRVQFANAVVERYLVQTGQKLTYSISFPDKPASALIPIQEGIVATTPTEFSAYLSSVVETVPSSPSGPVPLAPTNLSVSTGNEYISITFDQDTSNGATISNYEYSLDSGAFTAFSPAQTSSPIFIFGLTNNTTYSVRIRATNTFGAGASSDAVTGTPTGSETFTAFTTVGTTSWTAPTYTTSVTYLVVGGGGGSGGGFDTGGGGGGGAGEVVTGTLTVVGGTTYTVTVGDGGAAGISIRSPVSETSGGTGESSVFGSVTAVGGSGGFGSRNQAGGSGSGGARASTGVGGGAGRGGGSNGGGGGGGGNGSAGGNKSGTTAGAGGSGVSNSITGSPVTYGAGGNGATGNLNNAGVAGSANTGNGAKGGGAGGTAQNNGAKGGSGYVAIRFFQ